MDVVSKYQVTGMFHVTCFWFCNVFSIPKTEKASCFLLLIQGAPDCDSGLLTCGNIPMQSKYF